ncbi:MAG: hypothetical protein AAFQ66_01760 [Pseudomonadota bacterium]
MRLLLIFSLFAGPAHAATAPHLDLITQTDPLGFECVREEDLELAYRSGKYTYVPRTCDMEACNRPPEVLHLAGLLGRPPSETDWDEHYSRYADRCVAEVIPFWFELRDIAYLRGELAGLFGLPEPAPLIAVSTTPAANSSGNAPEQRLISTPTSGFGNGSIFSQVISFDPAPVPDGPAEVPASISLPAPLALLLAGLAGLWAARHRKSVRLIG